MFLVDKSHKTELSEDEEHSLPVEFQDKINNAMLNMMIRQQQQQQQQHHHQGAVYAPKGCTSELHQAAYFTAEGKAHHQQQTNVEYQKWMNWEPIACHDALPNRHEPAAFKLKSNHHDNHMPAFPAAAAASNNFKLQPNAQKQPSVNQLINNNNINNNTNGNKMSEVERIKQELLGYQREIELMQKQREYAKLMKQQKQQQQELERLKQECSKGAEGGPVTTNASSATETATGHTNGVQQANSVSHDEEADDLKRFERASKAESSQQQQQQQRFDPETLAALHHTHHHMQYQCQEQGKSNQIHEAAIHSKPLNYNNGNLTFGYVTINTI